jgi:glycosyltransferase involved in cell wall biosynthesis
MISGKTIFIAHTWSGGVSYTQQMKELALFFSANNKVVFMSAGKIGQPSLRINSNLTVYEWVNKRPTGLKDFKLAYGLMKQNKPDVIVTNFAANNIMLICGWLFNVPVRLCYFHTLVSQYIWDKGGIDTIQRINIFRKRLVYRFATALLPVSTAAKADLIQHYKVSPTKCIVFPNAISDKGIFNQNDSNAFGFIGRLDFSKGADILINAFSEVIKKYPDARLKIAGTGSKENDLNQLVKTLNLNNNVDFCGKIANNEIEQFLVSLNCLVVPSRIDNLPTVVLEAFSTATPVICSNSGGIPDMVEHEVNGLLFQSQNVHQLTEMMLVMLCNKEKRRRLAENARATFKEKFDIETLPLRFEKLLRSQGVN